MFSKDSLTLHHTIPTSNNPQGRRLWKTLREKQKMLVTSIFSFSHNVSTLSKREIIFLLSFNPSPNNTILDRTKLKTLADDKLNNAKTRISVFERVENTVGKGENAGYQHFLLYPQCFPKPSSLWSLKDRISVFERVENTVGKGENAGYQHFLLYPQCFPKPSSLWSLKDRIVW